MGAWYVVVFEWVCDVQLMFSWWVVVEYVGVGWWVVWCGGVMCL